MELIQNLFYLVFFFFFLFFFSYYNVFFCDVYECRSAKRKGVAQMGQSLKESILVLSALMLLLLLTYF